MTLNKKFTNVLFFTLAFLPFAMGQITVKGKVIDADTKETLPFCRIWVEGTSVSIASDIDGNFSISLPQPARFLTASMIGYDTLRRKLTDAPEQEIEFELKSSNQTLMEVVVYAGENPAHRIVKGIIKNKQTNRPRQLPHYQCETYTKTEFDMVNINEKVRKSRAMKPFDFVFKNIDSTSDEKVFLPVYMVETIADNFHTEGVDKMQSVPKAEKVAGDPNESFIATVRNMQSDFDVYDDWIYILEKPFVSPFANAGLFFYEYYISDSTIAADGAKKYTIRFKPRRKQENTFYGDFVVEDSSFAIEKTNMRMSPDVNINLINRIILFQSFEKNTSFTEGVKWLPAKSKMVLDFHITPKSPGMIGRKTVIFKDYHFQKDSLKQRLPNKKTPEPTLAQLQRDNDFWEKARPEVLTKNEASVYKMIDSFTNVPVYRTYVDVINTIVGGYKELGPIELGTYFSMYSYNPVEGSRFRLGARTTPDFSPKVRFGAFAAYGLKDQEWKYGANVQWLVRRDPRSMVGAAYAKDISSSSASSEAINLNDANFLTGFYRRPVLQKLMAVEETKIFYEQYLQGGWSGRVTLLDRQLAPFRTSSGSGFHYAFLPNPDAPSVIDTIVETSEAVLKARYAHGEEYIDGTFNRTKTGLQNFIFEAQYTYGKSGNPYHKMEIGVGGYFDINPIGRMNYQINGGKTFGKASFLLLHVAEGNESYSYETSSFNGMNRYEFVGDVYGSLVVTHHFNGLFLNKIPLLRKLNWREVVTFKAFTADMSDINRASNQLNLFDITAVNKTNYAGFRVPSAEPYMEASIGVENIFKVLRIDGVWRLNYLDNPEAARFALHVGFDFHF
ncbi:MAG: carboxypeptidase-like regulatory domain-containing protein [Saprospiraceae bacterium]|nr:carboxypeptidase-like regulatory domain-containing protein [Saprospiraceae bacterium]